MQLTLILKQVLPAICGQGKNGAWKKQELLFETDEHFPKKLCIAVWADKIEVETLVLNKKYITDFEIESRDFNSRWYTEMRLWRIADEKVDQKNDNSTTESNPFNLNSDLDILPF
jgi:hypothetical protein